MESVIAQKEVLAFDIIKKLYPGVCPLSKRLFLGPLSIKRQKPCKLIVYKAFAYGKVKLAYAK